MSDDEFAYSDDERKKSSAATIFKERQQREMAELDETLATYIEEWRKNREKEIDELEKLKEKVARRKIIRAEEEKKTLEKKKIEEEKKLKQESEARRKDEEERKKKLLDAEKQRHATNKGKDNMGKPSMPNIPGFGPGKTKEQLAEEKIIALSVRVAPLKDLEELGDEALIAKAEELWKRIIKIETEKYDYEQKLKRQEYDLRELSERQKQQLRQKAIKKGLDPEALIGKHPPKIQTANKFERKPDSRTYDDKKKLYEGGWSILNNEELEKWYKEKLEEFQSRTKTKLPKWMGERPGKKKGENDSDADDEDEEEDFAPATQEPEDEEEEEEEEEEDEEEEEEE